MVAMMKCGHPANAINSADHPVCAICVGVTPLARVVDDAPPALIGRQARCTCGKVVDSSTALPFYHYLGGGSVRAAETCAVCGYSIGTHAGHVNDHQFIPHGSYEYDEFYCGHVS